MRALILLLATVAVIVHAGGEVQAAPSFVWPLDPRPTVVNPFDPPEHDWLPGHRGVDVAGRDGQEVRAGGEGLGVFVCTIAGKPVVSVDHSNGLRSTYEPVVATVSAGERVRTGERIGQLVAGHSGCADACLHWGVRRSRVYLNPLALVDAMTIRLKPLGPR
nr:M23 family metallopeptidase [uncultured Rhodococcus sp.]